MGSVRFGWVGQGNVKDRFRLGYDRFGWVGLRSGFRLGWAGLGWAGLG